MSGGQHLPWNLLCHFLRSHTDGKADNQVGIHNAESLFTEFDGETRIARLLFSQLRVFLEAQIQQGIYTVGALNVCAQLVAVADTAAAVFSDQPG